MKSYKTLIVEDNSTALKDLLYYLNMKPYKSIINVAGIASTCRDAIDKLIGGSFQLLILDIELPDGCCFDIIKRMHRDSLEEIIFYTDYGSVYVQEMIDAAPIHYLRKPCSTPKIQEMILKIEDIFSKKLNPLQHVALLKNEDVVILINKDDILYIEYTDEKKVVYYRGENEKYIPAKDKKSLVNQISHLNRKFVQCHKNYIINIDFLNEYTPNEREGFNVKMPNGQKVEISKHFKDEVFSRKGVS